MRNLLSAFLRSGNYNVIVVDWSSFSLSTYSTAVMAVTGVGSSIATFLKNLKLPLNKVHIVGFNLGAHVAGVTGRNLEGKVARITGKFNVWFFCWFLLFIKQRGDWHSCYYLQLLKSSGIILMAKFFSIVLIHEV